MSKLEDFLSAEEEAAIIEAIRSAEKNTSGAAEVFDFLHMNNTQLSNGVLIYVAVEDRTLVIMGDQGINDVVPPGFWESTKDVIIDQFKSGNVKQGLVDGILMAGEQLKMYFPHGGNDKNELPDKISVG